MCPFSRHRDLFRYCLASSLELAFVIGSIWGYIRCTASTPPSLTSYVILCSILTFSVHGLGFTILNHVCKLDFIDYANKLLQTSPLLVARHGNTKQTAGCHPHSKAAITERFVLAFVFGSAANLPLFFAFFIRPALSKTFSWSAMGNLAVLVLLPLSGGKVASALSITACAAYQIYNMTPCIVLILSTFVLIPDWSATMAARLQQHTSSLEEAERARALAEIRAMRVFLALFDREMCTVILPALNLFRSCMVVSCVSAVIVFHVQLTLVMLLLTDILLFCLGALVL